MKLSDYVAEFIADQGIKHVFSVCGGGSMHLVDSVGKNERLQYVACHHEQAAAIAAEAYSRISGFGCALVTTGPGGTNAVTGVACAWIDSIPVLYVSGQVTRDTLLDGTGLRQFGLQETDIVTMVKSITKYAVTVMDEKAIRYELEKAAHIAKAGRPGPVWIDIPLDIQAKQIEPDKLQGYDRPWITGAIFNDDIKSTVAMLRESKRPVLIVGNGARGSDILRLVDVLNIPVITSWTGSDMLGDHPLHIGHIGIFGDRAANTVVQNSDLLLVVGCRLSIAQIGHNTKAFAPKAKIIMVDVDYREIKKPSLHVDLGICCTATNFIDAMMVLYEC